jgi:hypothetical protein
MSYDQISQCEIKIEIVKSNDLGLSPGISNYETDIPHYEILEEIIDK